jgi:hypothetical protein
VHDDAGVASGIYTTVQQMAGAFGVVLIGLLDAFFTTSSGSTLHAFVISVLVIMLLSVGLSFAVLPLRRPFVLKAERIEKEDCYYDQG